MNSDRTSDLSAELKSLAADLAALAPSSGGVNRDELMYRAGWEACAATLPAVHSVRQRAATWLWPLTTAALVLVATTLGVTLAKREPAVQIVYVEKPRSSAIEAEKQKATTVENVAVAYQPLWPASRIAAPSARQGNDYLSLREQLLALGADVLPASSDDELSNAASAIRDSRYGTLIRELRGG